MTTTPNLGLTLLESGQLQPDVTINQALTEIDDAWANVPSKLIGINAQTGTSYTVTATDLGSLVTFDNASPIAVEVPSDATENLPIGFSCLLAQIGDGQVTVEEEGSSVVIVTPATLSLRTKGAQASLVKIASDTWLLEGNLEAL